MKAIIIVPTFNEKENIYRLIPAIFSLSIPDDIQLELIVVDDNSPDGTAEIVEEMIKEYPIYLIRRRRKMGLGSAYITGFKKALSVEADFIFEMDADFSHDPQDIPRLLEAAREANLVIGSRRIKGGKIVGWNLWRKFMSTGAMIFSRLCLGLKTKDVTAGFRVFQRKVLETIPLDEVKSNGYAFQEEMLYRTQKLGFKIKEVPVTFTDRRAGCSKLSRKDIVEFFIVMLQLRLKKID